MYKLIDEMINEFRSSFNRTRTFNWFVIIIIGFMIRTDTLGTTSVIRDLLLNQSCYHTMLRFFRSNAWNIRSITEQWTRIVKKFAPLLTVDDCFILVGDGVKASKEGKKMPAVKKLHQESENSSKATYIFGHMFGSIGVIAGNINKLFCIPLSLKIHDGNQIINQWINKNKEDKKESSKKSNSHVVQIIKNGFNVCKNTGNSILLLDRYYLTEPALTELNRLNESHGKLLDIIVSVKKSYVAYTKPGKYKGKGRPRKKGEKIKLKECFEKRRNEFISTTVKIYGKKVKVDYLCLNLLWGKKEPQELRFVLVIYNNRFSILATTKLDLDPVKIITLYSYRFKIECTFRELKQVIGGFCYRFWSKSMPKLNRFKKKTEKDSLKEITSSRDKKLIINTLKAIEGYVMFSAILLGILQIISLKYSKQINKSPVRFLRTKSNKFVSEATVAYYLRRHIFVWFANLPQISISRIIKQKHAESPYIKDSLAS